MHEREIPVRSLPKHLLTRCSALTGYPQLARSLGLDPLAELRKVGLSTNCLQDPDGWISLEAGCRLLENAAQETRRDDFGLLMAEHRRISNLGMLGLLLREQPTCRQVLLMLDRYMHLQNEGLQLLFFENRDQFSLHVELAVRGLHSVRQAIDQTVGVVHRLMAQILREQWQPQVCFRHKAPRNIATHHNVFGDRITFGMPFNGFLLDTALLDAPVRDADAAFARLLEKQIERVRESPPELSVAARVRKLTWSLVPAGQCSADRVAQHLGLDRRTVHRHLAAEGSNFSAILDSVREEQVQVLLRQHWRSLTEIAALLGFSSVSAFSRWFQRHFAQSASDWRKSSAENTERQRAG